MCIKRAETTRAISQGPSNRAVYVISSPQQPPLQTVRRLSLLVKDSLPRDCPRQLVPSPRECFLPVYNIRFLHFFSSGKPRNGVEEPCRLLPLAESSAGQFYPSGSWIRFLSRVFHGFLHGKRTTIWRRSQEDTERATYSHVGSVTISFCETSKAESVELCQLHRVFLNSRGWPGLFAPPQDIVGRSICQSG